MAPQVVQGSADSIWSNTVLASYVYELMAKTGSPNTYAGYVEAAQVLKTHWYRCPWFRRSRRTEDATLAFNPKP